MQKLRQPLPKRSRMPMTVEDQETLVTDGKNFYLKKDANGEYPLTVINHVGDDPSYWTYLDLEGRIYHPSSTPTSYQGEIKDGTKHYSGLTGLAAKAWDNAVDWSNNVDVDNIFHPIALTVREVNEGRSPITAVTLSFDPTGVTTIAPRLIYNVGTDNTGVSDAADAALLSLPFAGRLKQLRRVLPVRMTTSSETAKRLESLRNYHNGRVYLWKRGVPDEVLNARVANPDIYKYYNEEDIIGLRKTADGRVYAEVNANAKPKVKIPETASSKKQNYVEGELFPDETVGEKPKGTITSETVKNQTPTNTKEEEKLLSNDTDKKTKKRSWGWLVFGWSKYEPNRGFIFKKPATYTMNTVKVGLPPVLFGPGLLGVGSGVVSKGIPAYFNWARETFNEYNRAVTGDTATVNTPSPVKRGEVKKDTAVISNTDATVDEKDKTGIPNSEYYEELINSVQ